MTDDNFEPADLEYRSEAMHDLAMAIRYDLTAAQGKLTELVRQIALVEPTAIIKCPAPGCGYRPSQNMPSLAEHIHTKHGGPPPPGWDDDAVGEFGSDLEKEPEPAT